MRPLVLFTDETDLDPAPGRALLEAAGCDTLLADLGNDRVLPPGAERAVALVVGFAQIDRDLLDRLPKVRCIATMSAGTDMVDRAECERRGIWLMNLQDAATEEVAVHALTLMLALERHLLGNLETAARGGWTDDVQAVPRRMSELTLGLYGYGRIARRLATLAAPLVGRIIAYDPFVAGAATSNLSGAPGAPGAPPTPQAPNFDLVDLDDLLRESDVLSLHSPLTDDTAGVINEVSLSKMPAGSILINVARGELVNQGALLRALDSGQLAGVGLDVLHGEPPAAHDPLRRHPRALVTPHIAFLSERSLEQHTVDPARNILTWLRAGELLNPVVRGTAAAPLLPA